MDLRLPLLADANLHIGIAEEAVAESAWVTARQELDKAEAALDELRQQWPQMQDNEKGLLSQMAAPLTARVESIKSRLPQASAVSEGEVVLDPEQDQEPEG